MDNVAAPAEGEEGESGKLYTAPQFILSWSILYSLLSISLGKKNWTEVSIYKMLLWLALNFATVFEILRSNCKSPVI